MTLTIEQPRCPFCNRKLRSVWMKRIGNILAEGWECPHGCEYSLTKTSFNRCPVCGQRKENTK